MSDSDLFSRDSEAWTEETIEEAKLRIAKIVERNRALRTRLSETPSKKKVTEKDLL